MTTLGGHDKIDEGNLRCHAVSSGRGVQSACGIRPCCLWLVRSAEYAGVCFPLEDRFFQPLAQPVHAPIPLSSLAAMSVASGIWPPTLEHVPPLHRVTPPPFPLQPCG